ncbi:TIR domain-containing protein [Clostridiaceae bacterium HSG29]|nr:TIR domain-containing protein [Clostridiaceae bacterium HSG29]
MAKKQVFYSFHFKNDVMRVQQIRNIGVLEGNSTVSANKWEEIKRKGNRSIQKWIEDNMKYKSCVIVLIGEETANRPWVKYEIEKAWKDGKGLLGIYIHNLKCPITGISKKGINPFSQFSFGSKSFADVVPCYDPISYNAYNDIAKNLDIWISHAIANRKKY